MLLRKLPSLTTIMVIRLVEFNEELSSAMHAKCCEGSGEGDE